MKIGCLRQTSLPQCEKCLELKRFVEKHYDSTEIRFKNKKMRVLLNQKNEYVCCFKLSLENHETRFRCAIGMAVIFGVSCIQRLQ